jgi:hypothetical protein
METALGSNSGSLEDLGYSGYDLLDKLSRRRQYVRSHVKERTCVMAFEPVQSYSDSDVEDLKISGCGWVVCENLANVVVFDIFLMAQKYIKIDSLFAGFYNIWDFFVFIDLGYFFSGDVVVIAS